jgi:DNA-binding HxlR family transcriptional regulator
MSSGIASLHKILKDETRSKIVLLLHEKGSLSYTELMKELKIVSTGKLNYHLKSLDDLIMKKEDGTYTLTEKGVLASKVLLEFPENNRLQLGIRPKWWSKFWVGALFFIAIAATIISTEYFLGNINLSGVYQATISVFGAIGLAYMIQHITRDILSKNTQLLLNKIMYTAVGVWIGVFVSFFGILLVSIISIHFGGPSIAESINTSFETISFLAVPAIIGGMAMYRFGRKRGFKRPQ